MIQTVKPIRRLLVEKSTTYGYRGYPKIYLLLECGHYEFVETYTRADRYVAGKTRMGCWKCGRIAAGLDPDKLSTAK